MIKQIAEAEKIFKEWLEMFKGGADKESEIRESGTGMGLIYEAFYYRYRTNGYELYYILDDAVESGDVDAALSLRIQIYFAEGRDTEIENTHWFGRVKEFYKKLYELTADEEIAALLAGDFEGYLNGLIADHKKRFPPSAAEAIWSGCAGGGRDPDIMNDLFGNGDN